METQIFTLHRNPRTGEIEAVGEPGALAVVPPLWAMYEGLWLTLLAQILLLAAAALYVPLGVGTVYLGLVLLTVFDGNSIHRLELMIAGWQSLGIVEARTAEGAEELFLRGEAVR